MQRNFEDYINEIHVKLAPQKNQIFKEFKLGERSEKLIDIYLDRNQIDDYDVIKKYLKLLCSNIEAILQEEYQDKLRAKRANFILELPINTLSKNPVPSKQHVIKLDGMMLVDTLRLINKTIDSSTDLAKEEKDYLFSTKQNIIRYRQMFLSQFNNVKKYASKCGIDPYNF